ncbi:MAG: alginate lyase family protein [Sphingomonas bacterium]|nr:alginate lyase family protein [Sphingomonas bacterium]
MMVFRLIVPVMLTIVAAVSPAAARGLPAPFDTPSARTIAAPTNCPPPPPPSVTVDVVQAYAAGDRSYSKVNPAKLAARNKALRAMRAFTSGVALTANRYVSSNGKRADQGGCALVWLKTWADAGALTKITGHDAQFALSVQLSGWTLDYMQVRDLHFTKDDPHVAIERWLALLADRLQAHTDTLKNTTARNNHRYWAGLAAMGVAAVTGDPARMRWAIGSARVGLDQISPQGTLPLELDRGRLALHYHLYAAAPLVMMAEIAREAKVDLYGYRGGALHRLVAFSTSSVGNPALITRLAGAPQSVAAKPASYADRQAIAWIEYYARRFPKRAPDLDRLLAFRPLRNPELGGDLTMLVRTRR